MSRQQRSPGLVWSLLGVVVLALLLGLQLAQTDGALAAATYTVDRTDDPEGVPDLCDPNAPNDCSLRGAIEKALDVGGDDDEIIIPDLGAPGPDVFVLDFGQITIPDSSLFITGAGRDITLIQGSSLGSRLFDLGTTVVTMSDLTIQNGFDTDLGGGIKVAVTGTLTLNNVAVRGNTTNNEGAGIHNAGGLTINNSLIQDNGDTNMFRGAGIFNTGTLEISDSAILSNGPDSPNDDAADGGAIYNGGSGSVELVRSTVADNNARNAGGIFNSGDSLDIIQSAFTNNRAFGGSGAIKTDDGALTIVNSTLSMNESDSFGGAIGVIDSTATVTNSTFYFNTPNQMTADDTIILRNTIVLGDDQAGDCDGSFTSLGNNIDSDGTCNLDQPTDQPGVDALLGPLQDNGGPTLTHALRPGSPAVNAGDNTTCDDTETVNNRDQRGITRPQGANCDIGAFESRFCNGQPETIVGDNAANVITGTPGDDVIFGFGGNDTINAGGGNDTICAGGADDTIDGGSGGDFIDGATGIDTVKFLGGEGRNINLVKGTVSGEGPGRRLSKIENIKGSNGADTILGNGKANKLEGNKGDDKLKGGSGPDNLLGGSGVDTLGGQGGSGDKCGGGTGQDKFLGGSRAASGCENVNSIP